MILLCDNDILKKLAACDLLATALDALSLTKEQLRILQTAPYVLGLAGAGKHRNTQHTLVQQRLGTFFDGVEYIDEKISTATVSAFAAVDEIDQGEAVLYATAVECEGYIITTGDKRSLRALSSAPTLSCYVERLRGRVVCLEQMVKIMIRRHGFDFIKQHVIPAREFDTALRVAFGSGEKAEESNVLAALQAYIDSLRSETATLLINEDELIPGVEIGSVM